MAEENYVIEMIGVTKAFGNYKANDDIFLSLKKGEIHALLGENGAGKSTLMNILSGLLEPTSGAIKVKGQEVHLDGNHPLAGQALRFSCKVTAVRAASAEEITHRHVHGEHGHQH